MRVFVIAMNNEAECVISLMSDVSEQKICGKRVICGTLFNKPTAVIVCGVGKVNAACGAQLAIDKFNANEIINLGVAGGLNGGVSLAKTYNISHAVQYDFDLTQLNGTQIGTLDECKENYIPLATSGVIVSMGSSGAAMVTENEQSLFVRAARGQLVNSVGAGDSMIAGFIHKFLHTNNYFAALNFATAAGSACAFTKNLATREQIEYIESLML